MTTLDLEYVRRQFPALSGEWTFFDNAGGSQTLMSVVRRIEEYLLTSNVQLGASYDISRRAGERVDAAREAMATYVNAASSSEIVMGPSTSLLLRVLASRIGQTLSRGDEVVVTNLDHEANIGPWVELAHQGATVRTWRVDPVTGLLDLDALDGLLTERTRVVAVSHASNVVGEINPIKQIARRAHEVGALVCVDGVAYAPHRRIDVRDLDVDFYAFSFYKVYGPHYALLYGKRAHFLKLPRFNHFFIGDGELPYKFQPGNVNYELSYGTLGLWDYFEALADAHGHGELRSDRAGLLDWVFAAISAHEQSLLEPLLAFLHSKERVRIIGSRTPNPEHRMPTVSFVVEGKRSDEIVSAVDAHKIGIRFGDFYARRLIDELGLAARNGVVRVSMVHYNTHAEVARLMDALDPLVQAAGTA